MAVGTEGDLHNLVPPAQVELYIVDPNPVVSPSPLYYFFNGTDLDGSRVVFRGDTYTPIAIEAKGFKITGDEDTLPRPKIRIGNVDGYMSGLLALYRKLVGAHFTRIVTYEPYLDGHDEADPLKVREEVTWVFNRVISETKFMIAWDLRHKADAILIFPRKSIGPWCANTVIYRGVDCGWAGANFDINDVEEGEPGYTGSDECGRRLESCMCRFHGLDGEPGYDPSIVLPFGGYPGVARPIS